MKPTILLILIILFASCEEPEPIILEPEPNIKLSTIRAQLLPDLNTYNYWKERSQEPGKRILYIHAEVCDTKKPPPENTDSIAYCFTLAESKAEERWVQITYLLNNSHLMCDSEKEKEAINTYHDSLKLSNYVYNHFTGMVEFSINFLSEVE